MSLFENLIRNFPIHINAILIGVGILSSANNLKAQVWQDYPQPIGDLARVWNIGGSLPFPVQSPPPAHAFPLPTIPLEELNYISAQWDSHMTTATVPFDLNFPVTEIISTSPQHFVRVYAPGNAPNTGSGPNGAWFMRSQDLRGLTPEQIKDRFALPAVPTMIVNVEFPASPSPSGKDYAIWTGIAGPIATWGEGGAFQNRIVSDFNGTNYFPNYAFTTGVRDHQQPIGAFALAYKPMAGTGNSGHIAAYLDKFIPAAFSDMDYVYTALDYLNWVNFGPAPLQGALNQISPERYGALPFLATRNALLFSNTLLDFRYLCPDCSTTCKSDLTCDVPIEPRFFLQWVSEQGQDYSKRKQRGFSYCTWGGIGNADLRLSKELTMGIQAAYFCNKIHFNHEGGSAHQQNVMGGLYATYDTSCYFLDGLLSGGYNWDRARRSIRFLGIDRSAHSRPSGFDVEAHLQYGLKLPICEWCLAPLCRLSYFYVRQNHFREHRADSLNLSVHSFSAQTLRTVLGAGLRRTFAIGCINLIPQIQLAWAHDFFLDKRKIGADLIKLGEIFKVGGFHGDRNSFLAATQLELEMSGHLSLICRYNSELEKALVSQAFQVSVEWNF